MKKQLNFRKPNGFSILEVLIGIFIFVVGMLALASLQGALTRAMADSKYRVTAVNIAERTIEAQRGFTQLRTAATPGVPFAYNDIVTPGTDPTVDVNGVTYTIDMDVTDYYYQLSTDTFCTVGVTGCPTGATSSDYKQVEITVSWNSDQSFREAEGNDITAADMGSGSITLTSAIPAVITSASARVANENTSGVLNTVADYNPGANPDVIALSLGDSKFKESLLPEPKVQRTDELVQTTFDVITYAQNNDGTQFLRREEFAAVSCECTLRAASADNLGRRPVIWAADEYMAGHDVEKAYGESANNKNSTLCDSCCRDHHDGGTSAEDNGDEYSNVYGPFKADTEYTNSGQARRTADHKHYQEDGVTIAANGDTYLEACRLVRVDGFFRVAQDFRREDQYVFPEDFMDINDDGTEIATYSGYVTTAAETYKNSVINDYPTNSPPCIGGYDSVTCPAPIASPVMQGSYQAALATGQFPSWTVLQTGVTDSQQLRSRGIYIDYLSNDLRLFMQQCFDGNGDLVNDCCIRNGSVANSCTADDLYIDKTGSSTKLEILPFFDVQLTKLENWEQTARTPLTIDLANEAIEDANEHDRGIAAQWSPINNDSIVLGGTEVMSNSHRGNIGFTNTLAIDPQFDSQVRHADLVVQSLDVSGNGSNTVGDPVITLEGSFTEGVSGDPTIEVVGVGDDVYCDLKPGGYYCYVNTDAVAPTFMVFGYEDTHVLDPLLTDPVDSLETRYACSLTLVHETGSPSAAVGDTNATFRLYNGSDLLVPDTSYDIEITTTSCDGWTPL